MATVSLQLYTLRDALAADRDATLAAVVAMGVDEVEPFGIETFGWLPEALAAHGLRAGSAHAGLLDAPDAVLDAATALGVRTVFQPHWDPLKWRDADGIRALADGLNAAAVRFGEAGIAVGYHNHDFEFTVPDVDGVPAYDYFVSLLQESVRLEVDTYWAAVGRRDVPELLATYDERITHLHLKDGPLSADHSVANVVLGSGAMDLPPILEASPDRVWVVEFDIAAIDPVDEVGRSIGYLRAAR